MSVDRYTKVVLTVIALCLVWLSIGVTPLAPRVSAQANDQRVVISGGGWERQAASAAKAGRVEQRPRRRRPGPVAGSVSDLAGESLTRCSIDEKDRRTD